MSDFLIDYHAIKPATWVYLSSLLMIGLFFKFGRFWSVRNLDLVLLILLGPGLLMVHYGQQQQASGIEGSEGSSPVSESDPNATAGSEPTFAAQSDPQEKNDLEGNLDKGQKREALGFICLFAVGGMLLTRLLLDPTMVRRPLLEPNLSLGGLTFISCALFFFLAANVIAEPVSALNSAEDYRIARVAPASTQGPGYALLSRFPENLSKTFSLVAQLGVVVGMILTGYWHFRNMLMGIGAATLYLMLPYTSLLTGRIEHVLPATFLVWAVLMYRRPLLAGALIGLASGVVYYPFFMLPLWLSFYWHKGFRRFLSSYLTTLVVLAFVLIVSPNNDLWQDLQRMFGLNAPVVKDLGGIWNPGANGLDGTWRLPVLVAFVVLSISMALWPAQKNLGTLLSCSAAIMVAAQFWHGYGGGTYMAWYLPLTLLTIFRPNLEDRMAVTVLGEGWFPKLANNLPKAA